MSFLIDIALRAPWLRRAGLGDERYTDGGYGKSNGFVDRWRNTSNAAGADVDGPAVMADNKFYLNGGLAIQGMMQTACYCQQANASLADAPFFIANQKLIVTGISEIHATAGNDAGAVTGVVRKCLDGQAAAAGSAIMTGSFNMKGTANTLQTATLVGDPGVLIMNAGDRLAFDFTGVLTTLAGVQVNVYYKPAVITPYTAFSRLDVSFFIATNTEVADKAFFVANRAYTVAAVRYMHITKGSDAGAVTVQLEKLTGTTAVGSGTNLLTNNSNAGFDCKGTNNAIQVGTLTGTAANLAMAAGDRLSLNFTGTLTALAGTLITVSMTTMEPYRQEVTFIQNAGAATNSAFFIADRDYRVKAISQVHSTAAGGTATADFEIDRGTTAPGSGTVVTSASTAFNLNGTANTVQNGTPNVVDSNLLLYAGDRLAFKWNNAIQSSAGVIGTVSLQAT